MVSVCLTRSGDAFEAIDEINSEIRLFLNCSSIFFIKSDKWELLHSVMYMKEEVFPEVLFYEIKDTREDEFSNWTSLENTTDRKRREITNFNAIKNKSFNPSVFKKIFL